MAVVRLAGHLDVNMLSGQYFFWQADDLQLSARFDGKLGDLAAQAACA